MSPRLLAFLVAAAFTAVVYLTARMSGKGGLILGTDGRPSTSKAQWWTWTMVAMFGYVAVFVEYWLRGSPGAVLKVPEVPQNLLLAMGFSGTTMAVAKVVTWTYDKQGLIDKDKAQSRDESGKLLGGIFTDDEGAPDLSKVQIIAFTIIAVFVYLVQLATRGTDVDHPLMADIDPSLMTLMGLSHAGYLGVKVATRDTKTDTSPKSDAKVAK